MFSMQFDSLYPLVQALGWALVHFLWQGAAIGALFALGMLALRSARPDFRYLFGLFCLALLALAPLLTFLEQFRLHAAAGPMAVAAVESVAASTPTSGAPGGLELAALLETALPWIVLAWLAGVLIHSLRVLVNWQRMRRLARIGVKPLSAALRERIALLCEHFGVPRAVTVLESTRVAVPTVMGWLKPVILLPTSSLTGLTPEQLELVIAHELGHIRRLDYLVNLAQVVIETVLFYHPVVGWISRRIRHEREQCCDDLVIRRFGNRLEYAKALTNLETMRGFDSRPALAATDGQLLQRIERIVCHHAARPRDALTGNTLVLMLLAAAIVMAAQVADPMASLDSERDSLAQTLVQELSLPAIPGGEERPMAELETARLSPSLPEPVTVNARRQPEPIALPSREDRLATSAGASASTAKPEPAPVAEQAPVRVSQLAEATAPATEQRQRVTEVAEEKPPALTRAQEPAAVSGASQAIASVRKPQPTPVDARSQLTQAETAPSGPQAVERVAPSYPIRARMAGLEGHVTVEFSVRGDGSVHDVSILEARPRRVFDRSAMRAIRDWRFDPATVPSGKRVTQRFDFNLGRNAPLVDQRDASCEPVTGTRICRSGSPTSLRTVELAN